MKLLAKGIAVLLASSAGITLLLAQPALPASDVAKEIAGIKAQMRADHQAVLGMRAQAMKEKDPIRYNCVNDKLAAMLAMMNTADTDAAKAKAAVGSDQVSAMADVRRSGQQVSEQREAAAQCKKSETVIGESSSSFEADGDLGNPWDEPPDFGEDVVPEPPGYASPDQ